MNEKALRVLEYNKIINLLLAEAVSQMAKEMFSELKPSTDAYEIRQLLSETSEAVSAIFKKGYLPLNHLYPIKNAVIVTQKGGSVSAKQLLEILYNLQTARKVLNFLKNDISDIPILSALCDGVVPQKKLEEEIDRCIISEDEISDNASPLLRDIRRSITRQNEALRNKLNSILNSSENRTYLQDTLFTMRQGRYVLPVKLEHKSKFSGIVHDQSSTGATLFIEPAAIVNLNNELKELHLKEKAEIERILTELSAKVSEVAEEILINQEIMIKLDFIFAKGKLAVKMKAIEPGVSDKGIIRIKEGRHPLLDPKKVVPISLLMGNEYNTLVITGPNTGGKTVTLKTVGLFLLMMQSGLHVPAEFGTELSVFNSIYADIGDEQSIEQSLSTFSSHMTNIVDIVDHSDHKSLVLVDELGAGTDPTEGAALAISILDHLYKNGAKTIATTHYTELKKYALVTEGVENASVEFDIETLSPTYKLLIGTPGRSNAFEISKKLGLSDLIINDARQQLGKEDIEFEEILKKIGKDRKQAEDERDEAIKLNIEMKKLKEDLEKQKIKLGDQKERIIREAKEEARELLKDAKEFSDEVFKELRALENMAQGRERNKSLENIRKKVKDKSGRYNNTVDYYVNDKPVKPKELKIGDTVQVISLDQVGNVISLPDDKNELLVQVGLLKVNVNLNNIAKIDEARSQKGSKKTSFGELYRTKTQNISTSVNVIGLQLEDAVMEVDKYLDDAYIAGLKQVTVIHGRGEGILRNGIKDLLKTHKHVENFRKGGYNEGGDGVTVVELK